MEDDAGVGGGRSAGRLDDLLDMLAGLEAGTGTPVRPLLEQVGPMIPSNAQVLFLSPRAEAINAEWPVDLNLPAIRIVEASRAKLEPLFDWVQSGA